MHTILIEYECYNLILNPLPKMMKIRSKNKIHFLTFLLFEKQYIYFFEMGSHYVALVGLQLAM